MKSLFLLSLIVATVMIPAIAARDPNPRRGVRRMLLWLFVFQGLYVAHLTLVHATFFVPSP